MQSVGDNWHGSDVFFSKSDGSPLTLLLLLLVIFNNSLIIYIINIIFNNL